jgi:hypothetical protein
MAAQMGGTINGYCTMSAKCGNGTTKGLTRTALAIGLPVGSIIETEGGTRMQLVSAPHDDRVGGYWCDRVWAK